MSDITTAFEILAMLKRWASGDCGRNRGSDGKRPSTPEHDEVCHYCAAETLLNRMDHVPMNNAPKFVSLHSVSGFAFGEGNPATAHRYYVRGLAGIDSDGRCWFLCNDYIAGTEQGREVLLWKRFETEFVP